MLLPIIALLINAAVWGLVWYPYRLMAEQSLNPVAAITATSVVAFCIGLFVFNRHVRGAYFHPILLLVASATGLANLAFVWATTHGEVVRAVLLFYMLPIWTAIFARIILKERLNVSSSAALCLGLIGTAIMLWNPRVGAPFPANNAEWAALLAGMSFGLSNVLASKIHHIDNKVRALWSLGGNVLMGLIWLLLISPVPGNSFTVLYNCWGLIVGTGFALLFAGIFLQYGILKLSAIQVAIVSLFELIVAAVASWILVNESIYFHTFIGGGLIVISGLLVTCPRPKS